MTSTVTLREEDGREVVVVSGHRNPDMDSICSALAYANLKNIMDPKRRYVAVAQGLTDMCQSLLNRIGAKPPLIVATLKPIVADVMIEPPVILQASDPVLSYCEAQQQHDLSIVPLLEGSSFFGIVSFDDVTSWFIKCASMEMPVLEFDLDNFPRVMRGSWLKRGSRFITSSVALGMMKFARFREFLRRRERSSLPIMVLADRVRHIQAAAEAGVPAIVLVGVREPGNLVEMLNDYSGSVFMTEDATTDQVFQLISLSCPLRTLLRDQPPSVAARDDCDEVRDQLAKSGHTAFPVVSGTRLLGLVSRNELLAKPKRKVILVDHNEESQAMPGFESAEVVEIIDHHRLASARTQVPIFIDAEPLGSTCTLVYGLYRRNDVPIDQVTAKLLLSGLLTDTLCLRSPTTTARDRSVAQNLAQCARVNLVQFGSELMSKASVAGQDPLKVINQDFKAFNESEVRFGIGQCEVGTWDGLKESRAALLTTLEAVRVQQNLDLAMLVVTNVSAEGSRILTTPHKVLPLLAYRSVGDGELDAPGAVSRKMQILPEVTRALTLLVQ